jgi:hypothetical protein
MPFPKIAPEDEIFTVRDVAALIKQSQRQAQTLPINHPKASCACLAQKETPRRAISLRSSVTCKNAKEFTSSCELCGNRPHHSLSPANSAEPSNLDEGPSPRN